METCDAAFKQLVRLRCYDALERNGFIRFRREGVDWPLEDGFHCWVGLNTGLYEEYVQINPFVGVHAVPVERFWNRISGQKYDRGSATYAIHIGKISPHVGVFRFTRDTDIDAEAERLALLYVDVGLPFAKAIASYDALLPLLVKRSESLGAYPYRVAACLYLTGRFADARFFIEDFMDRHPRYIETFAVPFLALPEVARSHACPHQP
jgi:hypothetical protein